MLGTRYRGRRQGVEIRSGSVEQARREAHMTLAQVAAGKLTRTAIHLIEKGRTRPSMETLQLIAVRQLESVIQMGTSLLEQKWNADDTAVIHFSIGQAYCRLVRPAEALEHLTVAREQFERSGDEWMAVEAMDWESSALGLLDDPEALPLANRALERCRQLQPKATQIEARILGHIAAMYVVAHSWVTAIRYYEAAATAASGVKDLQQMAKMNHGLGRAYQSMQQPGTARQHYDKALAGSNELKMDRRGHGFMLVNLGDVHLRRGELAQAEAYLFQALEVAEAI